MITPYKWGWGVGAAAIAFWGWTQGAGVHDFDAIKFIPARDIPKEVRGCNSIKFIPSGYVLKGTHNGGIKEVYKEVHNNEEAIKMGKRVDAIKFIPARDIPKEVHEGAHKEVRSSGEIIKAKVVKNEAPISYRYV